MGAAARRRIIGLAISFAYFALIAGGTARSSYSKTIDLAIVAVSLILIAALSILRLQDFVLGYRRSHTFLRRWRRWVTDDYPTS
jgi:hypothetical protein